MCQGKAALGKGGAHPSQKGFPFLQPQNGTAVKTLLHSLQMLWPHTALLLQRCWLAGASLAIASMHREAN